MKALRRHAVATDDGLGECTVSYRIYGNGTSFVGTTAEQFDQVKRLLDQVFTFVLCGRFLANPQTMLNNFANECGIVGATFVDNMVTSLADGGIYPFNSRTGSITHAMTDGDGAIFSKDPIASFAQLLTMLHLYVMSGRTTDRKHYERYFRPIGGSAPTFTIDAQVTI